MLVLVLVLVQVWEAPPPIVAEPHSELTGIASAPKRAVGSVLPRPVRNNRGTGGFDEGGLRTIVTLFLQCFMLTFCQWTCSAALAASSSVCRVCTLPAQSCGQIYVVYSIFNSYRQRAGWLLIQVTLERGCGRPHSRLSFH